MPQLRHLDLQFAFARARVSGEDVQDQNRTVEHLDVSESALQRRALPGPQRIERHDGCGFRLVQERFELFDLSKAQQRRRIRFGSALNKLCDHFGAGSLR